VLAKEKHGIRGRDLAELQANFIPFTAQSRMSGVEVGGSWVRKGAVDSILNFLNAAAPTVAGAGATARMLQPMVNAETVREVQAITDTIAKSGGTPLAVAKDGKLLWRRSPQGYRQGWHPRALCRASPNGHTYRHDNR
jgi:potassium-transporting ATPase ATP-binding subunit